MNQTERITFSATKELKAEISKFAMLQGISSGQLIRNFVEEYLKTQVLHSHSHYYELQDGTQFPNMKVMCQVLKISSLTARKRIKSGVIKKITINTYQTQQYGNEISTTRSRTTGKNRL